MYWMTAVDKEETVYGMMALKSKRWRNVNELPLDGGWGWMVVLGCMLMNLLVGGIGRSYGVIFVRLQQQFNSSASITAGVGGAAAAICMAFSPLATSLSSRFGTRPVTVLGGCFCLVGCVISAFTPTTEFLFFSYSLLAGFGMSLAYAPSHVLVGQYFRKYRGIAIGLGSAGAGLGAFGMPPLVDYLFVSFGYKGTFLILGAIMMNMCVCGALYRPLKENIQIKSDPENNVSLESLVNVPSASPQDEIKSTISESKEERGSLSVEYEPSERNNGSGCRKNNVACMKLSKYIDLTLFCEPVFLVLMLALTFHTMGYVASQMLLPALSKKHGHSQSASVFLISILGICDMCGRITAGIIFDVPFLRQHRNFMYNITLAVVASTQFLWAFCHSYTSLTLATVLHGIFNGCMVSQRTTILADLFGVEKLSSSFGLSAFVLACANVTGPALAGYLADQLGVYTWSFVFMGILSLLGTALYFLSTRIHMWRHKPK